MNTKDPVGNEPGSAARLTILEVVSEFDACADLTPAYDFYGAFGGAFDTHLVGIGGGNSPFSKHHGTHWVSADGPARDAVLATLFERIRPDIVHTHRVADLAFVGPAARRAGVPVLLHTVCGDIATAELSRIEHFRGVVSSLGPIVVAPSVEAACHINPATRVAVIPRGIDCARYRPGSQVRARRKIGLPAGPRVIGCASPAGGLDTLFQALFRLAPDVHLALFGPAQPGVEERRLIRRLGLEERVHVLGGWAPPEMVHQAIDIYFHGPSGDRSPRPILAAQACGRPVVATYPVEPESLCPATGHLVPAPYQPALIGALKRAISRTPNLVARSFVESRWDIAASIAGYETILRRALGHTAVNGAT